MSKKARRAIPLYERPIIETHCHLDYLDEPELSAVLETCAGTGIEKLISIAVSAENLSVVRDLASRYDQVYCTQGIHPHDAASFSESIGRQIVEGCANEKVVAIGEIGLDYHYDHADRTTQHQCFRDQLAIAAQLELPVVIHTREADDDTRMILSEHLSALPRTGVLHSFSSSLELAEFALGAGWYLGFNGMVTFKSAELVREAVRLTPLNRLLLETDSPYLTPEPYRGRPNRPFYLPFIAEKIAELKEVPVPTLLDRCRENSQRLFFSRMEATQ